MKNARGTLPVNKTLISAALVASLSVVAIGCDNDEATPEPTTPAEAVESMAAEEVEAVESMAAEDVEDAEETMEAEESMAAEDVEDAEAAEESPEA
jgi:hypothetical protein